MSLKNANTSSLSITARLAGMYAVTTFLILLLVTLLLYWALQDILNRTAKQLFVNEISTIRTILYKHGYQMPTLEQEVTWITVPREDKAYDYFIRLINQEGQVMLETPGMSRTVPRGTGFPSVPAHSKQISQSRYYVTKNGDRFLLMNAWGMVNKNNNEWANIQMALDVSYQDRILKQYGNILIGFLIFGTLVASLMGIFVARNGMRPLHDMSNTLENINVNRLHRRLDVHRWPKELATLTNTLNNMLARIEKAFNRLSQFSGDLAHELRTPINNLMGEAEITLSHGKNLQEYQATLESSLEEYHRLTSMIECLLFLARAENPHLSIKKQSLDARKELDAICSFHEIIAEEEGIELNCHGYAQLNADPILFRRALNNLIANALHHTNAGGKIDVYAKRVDGNHVKISVVDNGCGIAAEHLEHIFERFYRPDAARSKQSGGTGLGLAIVKSIMDLHNGTITIESEVGKGTQVNLVF